MTGSRALFMLILLGGLVIRAHAQYMDVVEVNGGIGGTFNATLGSMDIEGSLASSQEVGFRISPTNHPNSWANTVLDGSALQFGDAAIFTPANPMGDKVGLLMVAVEALAPDVLTIEFSQPFTNPVLHIANIDNMTMDFTPSGITREQIVVLSHNGGPDGDGFMVEPDQPVIKDGFPPTTIGTLDDQPIPLYPSSRSAYGSFMLLGTFDELVIDLVPNPERAAGDGNTFQISRAGEEPCGPPAPPSVTVTVDSGDEAGLIAAILDAETLYNASRARTRIAVLDNSEDFEFTEPFNGSLNALPDYTGAYVLAPQNSANKVRLSRSGEVTTPFRLVTVTRGLFELHHAEITGFFVPEDDGGAILVRDSGELHVSHSRFHLNIAGGMGGAIHRSGIGEFQVRTSEFIDNLSSAAGGAISLAGFDYEYHPIAVMANRFFANSSAQSGAAIQVSVAHESGDPVLIAENYFEDANTSVSVADMGLPARLRHNTFAGMGAALDAPGTAVLFGNILAADDSQSQVHSGDGGGKARPQDQCLDPLDALISLGFNIAVDATCALDQANDLAGTDPQLAPPDFTGVRGLAAGSPGIDHGADDVFYWAGGEPAALPCGTIDALGNARPQDADGDNQFQCDAGAVETIGAGEVVDGHSGAFFNALRDGEGTYVEVLPGGLVVVYTFTYRPNGGGPAWFIGVGRIVGNGIVIEELLRPSGTSFGDGFNANDIVLNPAGQMSMVFPTCEAGSASAGNVAYSGTQATCPQEAAYEGLITKAQRLSNIVGCGSSIPAENAGLSGSYFDPSRNGEGIIVEWLTDGRVLVVFFTYDLNGDQMWLIGVGTPEGNFVSMEALYASTYTRWGQAYNPDAVTVSSWGTFQLGWSSCNAVTFAYTSTVPGYGSATREYTRLSMLAGTECPEF